MKPTLKKQYSAVLDAADNDKYTKVDNEKREVSTPYTRTIIGGMDLIRNPRYNKGNSFTTAERDQLHVRGLVPYAYEDQEKQVKRELTQLRKKTSPIEKYSYMMSLLDRNEKLFYRLLIDNIVECMPIVYTPTVGQACQEYGAMWTSPKGIYINIEDRGRVFSILKNWRETNIKAIVFTDGERILGLGDLGVNGMGIPVGKLELYSACAGIPPSQCLPVCIDVGTDNEDLLADEFYMGIRQKRVRGQEYYDLVLEFMLAAQRRFGRNVLLQFEDFGNHTAFELLEMTKDRFCTFNDDIQGTASVTLAGLLASEKLTAAAGGPTRLSEHTIVFLGAGEAGVGIADLIMHAIIEEARERDGKTITEDEAKKNIWLIDSKGLVTAARHKNGEFSKRGMHKIGYAHKTNFGDKPTTSLIECVNILNPTALIGVSATPSTFTKEVLEKVALDNPMPLVFALSNPTSKAECSAEEAYIHTKGKCIFASGSPFDPVTLQVDGEMKTFHPAQSNNCYIFPGLALGVISSESCRVPNELLYVASKSLAAQVKQSDLDIGAVFPPLETIRDVSAIIAADVAERCYELSIACNLPKPTDIPKYVLSRMSSAKYRQYAYNPKM